MCSPRLYAASCGIWFLGVAAAYALAGGPSRVDRLTTGEILAAVAILSGCTALGRLLVQWERTTMPQFFGSILLGILGALCVAFATLDFERQHPLLILSLGIVFGWLGWEGMAWIGHAVLMWLGESLRELLRILPKDDDDDGKRP